VGDPHGRSRITMAAFERPSKADGLTRLRLTLGSGPNKEGLQ